MEVELKGLIEKIKKDGVEEAEKEARDIIGKAEKEAKDIVANAGEKGKGIVKHAEEEADILKKQAGESIRQSVRDSVLMLKQKIVGVFDTVLKREVSQQLEISALGEAIVKLIENFKKGEALDIEILLGEKDKKKVQEVLVNSLTKEMQKGIAIKVSPEIERGFRIGKKGENYYYDFTDDAVAEALRQYLNPKLIKILDAGKTE